MPAWHRTTHVTRQPESCTSKISQSRRADKLLTDSDLPRYHRIKLYLLVAACLEDDIEADDLVERPQSQWRDGT